MEDLHRLVRVERRNDLRDRVEIAVDELAEPSVVVDAPVPERPATKSSKPGMQNVFWTSTASRQMRKRVVRGGREPVLRAQARASAARSS